MLKYPADSLCNNCNIVIITTFFFKIPDGATGKKQNERQLSVDAESN